MSDFLWFTNEGQTLSPREMTTLHLFHSIRMIWNHTVAPEHQLNPFRAWSIHWDADFRATAMVKLTKELKRRKVKKELTDDQRADLKAIAKGRKVFDEAVKRFDEGDWQDGDYDEEEEALWRDIIMDEN